MNPQKLRRLRRRNFLVISAAGLHSGLQFLYLQIKKNSWSVVEYQVSPYLQKIRSQVSDLLDKASNENAIKDIAWLDRQLSLFYLESTRSFLSLLPRHAQKPDLLILSRFSLWNDFVENEMEARWNLPLGDPQIMANELQIPILTDFLRHDILNEGTGSLPVLEGDRRLAQSVGETAVFVNIGLQAQVTILSKDKIVDSISGPGTCLINKAASETGANEGFDRDGSLAQQGEVDTDCLEFLASDDWFKQAAPKTAKIEFFDKWYHKECLQRIKPIDRLSTITALTARTISNFLKKELDGLQTPHAIYVSGGGVNNIVLIELLGAYLSPVPVKSVEELGIPTEGRIPLSLGLAVDRFIQGKQRMKGHKLSKEKMPLGKWIFP